MGDLIDRQGAIDNFIADKDAWEIYGIEYYDGKKYIQFDDVIEELKTLPTVQSEHNVIMCKDCKYVWCEDGWDNLYCKRVKDSFSVEKEGFCAWGEKEQKKMTLDEQITILQHNAEHERTHGNLQGCLDFRQLVKWLKDYKHLLSSRKFGEWEHEEGVYGVAFCSNCDYELHTNDTNYCPNCGSIMAKEGDTE